MKRHPSNEQKGSTRSEAIPQVEAGKRAHGKHSARAARPKPAPTPTPKVRKMPTVVEPPAPSYVEDERPLEELLHQDTCD